MHIPDKRAARERFSFNLRLLTLVVLVLAGFGVLGLRMFHLAVVRGDDLHDLSEQKFVRREEIAAPRGRIVDRRGRPLAVNERRFNLRVSPYRITEAERDVLERTLGTIQRFVPEADVPPAEEILSIRSRRARFEGVLAAENLTTTEALPLLERQARLPGLKIEETFVRRYPEGRTAGQWTGYTGAISAGEKEEYLEAGYRLNDAVGKQGLEKTYESWLKGEKGVEGVLRDAYGRKLQSWVEPGDRAEPGCMLRLTMDLDLQTSVTQALASFEFRTSETAPLTPLKAGAVVALDPRTGEILALASTPGYDPNRPGLPGDTELNRAFVSRYAPGSTWKLVTAAAALLDGRSPDRLIDCQHRLTITQDYRPKCEGWHGPIDMRRALTVSCNIYFYQLALEMEGSHMVRTGMLFGFGSPTGVELRESAGVLREPQHLYVADRVMLGIGQGGAVAVTPLQMAVAYAALANGGRVLQPTLVKEIEKPDGEPVFLAQPVVRGELPWTESQRGALLEGFRGVVEDTRSGTGRRAGFPPAMKVAGKTGSAEHGRDAPTHSWFVCFAPWDAPEIVVAVLLEDAGHGGETAAPFAFGVLDKYYRLRAERGEAPYPGKSLSLAPAVPGML